MMRPGRKRGLPQATWQSAHATPEIELLHEKIDLLREQEIKALTSLVDRLVRRLEDQPGATNQETRP